MTTQETETPTTCDDGCIARFRAPIFCVIPQCESLAADAGDADSNGYVPYVCEAYSHGFKAQGLQEWRCVNCSRFWTMVQGGTHSRATVADVRAEYEVSDHGTIKSLGQFEGQPIWVPLAYEQLGGGGWSDEYTNPNTEQIETAWTQVNANDVMAWALDPDTVSVALEFSDQGFVSGEEMDAERWALFQARLETVEAEDSSNQDASSALETLKRCIEVLQRVSESGETHHPSAMSEWEELAETIAEQAGGVVAVLERSLPEVWET